MKKEYLREASDIVKDFLIYMQNVQEKSETTLNVYYVDLRMFFKFMKKRRGLVGAEVDLKDIGIKDIDINFIKTIDFEDIKSFMTFCMEERGNRAAARSKKCSVLNTFFNYLTKKVRLLKENPAENIDFPKKAKVLPKYLTLEQSIALLKSVDGEYKERDYCILTLFLNCGMRLSELVGINMNDIMENNMLRIFGKGRKERIVYLNEACNHALQEYLKVRPENAEDKNALFISKRNKRIKVCYSLGSNLNPINLRSDCISNSLEKLILDSIESVLCS